VGEVNRYLVVLCLWLCSSFWPNELSLAGPTICGSGTVALAGLAH
jgi:hypothetical protein